jgi:ribosome-associated protein
MDFIHKELAEKIISWAEARKAEDIKFYDVRDKTDYTDGVIICHGTADLHVKAIGEYIIEKAKEERIQILSSEGLNNSVWILLDFIDIVVHIFNEETRHYYQLEDLFTIKKKKELVNENVESQN